MALSSLHPAGRALAGPWSTQPVIGLAAQYVVNPQFSGAQSPPSETHAALFANVPLNYDADQFHFVLDPSARYGNTTGYSSVTSNYYYVDTTLQYNTDFNVFSLSGYFHRDASLLYAAEIADGISQRRDTSNAQANWMRVLTERAQFNFNASVIRTLYESDHGGSGLVDYKYSSLSPSLSYALTERDTVKVLGGTGRYDSLNELTSSKSANVQLGLDHRFSELWTASATAGYSKATNRYKIYFGPFYLGTEETRQNGAVYSLSLERHSPLLDFKASAYRALTATGFTFLSRQDTLALGATYNRDARWSFSGFLNWTGVADPLIGGGESKHRFYTVGVLASYRLTERWGLALRASKVKQQFGAGTGNPASSGVSLEISRQFDRTNQ